MIFSLVEVISERLLNLNLKGKIDLPLQNDIVYKLKIYSMRYLNYFLSMLNRLILKAYYTTHGNRQLDI